MVRMDGNMKIKDLLDKLTELEKVAKDYFDTHYCGYMGEWVNDGSEEEYLKLRQNVIDYLDSEVKL